MRTLLVLLVALSFVEGASGQSLRGSVSSMDRQNQQARAHDFSYLNTGSRVLRFVEAGYLVPVRGNRDYDLHAVSYPYARPEVALFIRRIAGQYRSACGEKLVVTSLTRPTSSQPRNASARSVHPTGMAVDFRYPANRRCRSWLEDVLLGLEKGGMLEATRERYPAHYHVAVFPEPYSDYVSGRRSTVVTHRVARGDNLSTLAQRYRTTVREILSLNNLRSDRIYVGQTLRIRRGS